MLFLGGDNISLIGADIHSKYCLGIIEGNNTETTLRFPNTQNGWKAIMCQYCCNFRMFMHKSFEFTANSIHYQSI